MKFFGAILALVAISSAAQARTEKNFVLNCQAGGSSVGELNVTLMSDLETIQSATLNINAMPDQSYTATTEGNNYVLTNVNLQGDPAFLRMLPKTLIIPSSLMTGNDTAMPVQIGVDKYDSTGNPSPNNPWACTKLAPMGG